MRARRSAARWRAAPSEVHGAIGPMELNIPAIEGIGGSNLYLVDRYGAHEIYDVDFVPIEGAARTGARRQRRAHLHRSSDAQRASRQHADLGGFLSSACSTSAQIRYFDIEGKVTGLFSKAMTSPDGKIRIPLNESQDDKSQIEEFLHDYKGEGIQHVALGTDDIYSTVDRMRARGVQLPGHARYLFRRASTRACRGTARTSRACARAAS